MSVKVKGQCESCRRVGYIFKFSKLCLSCEREVDRYIARLFPDGGLKTIDNTNSDSSAKQKPQGTGNRNTDS